MTKLPVFDRDAPAVEHRQFVAIRRQGFNTQADPCRLKPMCG